MRGVDAELTRVRRAAAEREARQELVGFQLAELDRAAPTAGEDEELAALRQVLASAERVERLCAESYASLYERATTRFSRGSAASGGGWRSWRRSIRSFSPTWTRATASSRSSRIWRSSCGATPTASRPRPRGCSRSKSGSRCSSGLKRKHGPTLADVIARRDAFRRELSDLQHADERVAELERAHRAARDAYVGAATALSAARRRAAPTFSNALEGFLAELAMGKTRFEVRFGDEPLAGTGVGAERVRCG